MSQRGYRRDGGRQSYQMNSSAHYGGRSGQMNVNPWEGGLVPGGRGGLAGLLPTPTQSNILSQLSSSPEAQLAIASNLLSTLLRPQHQAPQVPSLLSLGSLGPMGGSGGGYRQSGYGPDSGRYQDQGPNRRKRMDTRRTEPYKNLQSRRLPSSRGGAEKKPGSQGLRSPSVGKSRSSSGSKPGGKADKKDDEKEPKKEKDQDDDKNEDEKKTDEEDGKRDEGEEGEKKREWKDEKKTDDSSNENDEKEDKEKDEKPKEREKDEKPHSTSRYSGIPPSLFYCHVCKKHMWDENSFQNHLKGRTHLLMMDKLEESYKIRVELMRHEQKVREQQREIELERMKRQGKKVNLNIREYCTMCDLHFFGNLIVHRKNDRHQQLKNFLHPRCLPCGKEFPTRVEWDHHKLTPLHLRKTADSSKNRKSGSDDDEFGIEALISGEGSVFGDDSSKGDIKVGSQDDDIKETEENEEGDKEKAGEKNAEESEKTEGKKEEETTIIGNLRFRVPKYNPDVSVGLSLLKKMTGQTCRACHRFFINPDDAKTHCRTLMHYNKFVELIKEKAKAAEAKEKREAKKKEESGEKGSKRAEDMSTVDDEGNWKRRKVEKTEEDDEEADVSAANEGSISETPDKKEKKEESQEKPANGNEKYDPLEADAEESSPEDDAKGSQSETPVKDGEDKGKKKDDSITGDDNLWAEVDRDIGNLLDTVDGEGETESLTDLTDDDPASKQDSDGAAKGIRTSVSRNKATRGALTGNKAIRGRKKK